MLCALYSVQCAVYTVQCRVACRSDTLLSDSDCRAEDRSATSQIYRNPLPPLSSTFRISQTPCPSCQCQHLPTPQSKKSSWLDQSSRGVRTLLDRDRLYKCYKIYTRIISDQKFYPPKKRETTNKYKLQEKFSKAKLACYHFAIIFY